MMPDDDPFKICQIMAFPIQFPLQQVNNCLLGSADILARAENILVEYLIYTSEMQADL